MSLPRLSTTPPMPSRGLAARALALVALLTPPTSALAQNAAPADSVPAILAPRTLIPPEAATAGVKRFSFIAYGERAVGTTAWSSRPSINS